MEYQLAPRPVTEIFNDILRNEPRPVAAYVPGNADEQRVLFLRNEIDNPRHTYPKLDTIDFEARDRRLQELLVELQAHNEVNAKHLITYEDFITSFRQSNRRMQIAHALHDDTLGGAQRADLEREFIELNVETYGAPDLDAYKSLVAELKAALAKKHFTNQASVIYEELLAMLPGTEDAASERYRPSREVVEWVEGVVESLYGNLLRHVPERDEPFQPTEVRDIFESIIREEFGASAAEWRVSLTDSVSINVSVGERLVKVPQNRAPVPHEELKGLVAHELGVHMLRAVMGEQTDLLPMQVGFANYGDAEEGLGKVMEQAVRGKYVDAGIPYYLVASLMYHDHKDFRGAFEVMWRRNLLLGAKEGSEVSNEAIEKARTDAYKTVMRITRGTDTLPWFKDLSYYNGTISQWQHLETIMGDDLLFTFVLLGKANAANKEHERIMYETQTK